MFEDAEHLRKNPKTTASVCHRARARARAKMSRGRGEGQHFGLALSTFSVLGCCVCFVARIVQQMPRRWQGQEPEHRAHRGKRQGRQAPHSYEQASYSTTLIIISTAVAQSPIIAIWLFVIVNTWFDNTRDWYYSFAHKKQVGITIIAFATQKFLFVLLFFVNIILAWWQKLYLGSADCVIVYIYCKTI